MKAALKQSQSNHYEIVLHNHQFRLVDVPAGELAFFILRDPVSRFVSSFNSRLRQGKPRYHSPWNSEEEVAFKRFATPNALAEAIYHDDPLIREYAEHAMSSISHIKNHMSHWIGPLERTDLERVAYIGLQHHLSKHFAELCDGLQIKNRINLPTSDIEAHRNPMHMDTGLSDLARNALYRWYEHDHKIYERAVNLSGRWLYR